MTSNLRAEEKKWFICTLGKSTSHNWELCKEFKVWGIPTNGRNYNLTQAVQGDYLLFYLAGNGFLGIAQVTGPMRRPISKDEAPWAGGIYRYGVIVPFKLTKEVDKPIKVHFESNKIESTSVSATLLRRGFAQVSASDGLKIQKKFL